MGPRQRRYLNFALSIPPRAYFGGKRRILVAGMRRSGNHALIDWLASSIEGAPVSFNMHREDRHLWVSSSGGVVHINEGDLLCHDRYYKMLWRHRDAISNAHTIIFSVEDFAPPRSYSRFPYFDHGFRVQRSTLNTVASRLKTIEIKSGQGLGAGDMSVDPKFMRTARALMANDSLQPWKYEDWVDSAVYRSSFLRRIGLESDISIGMSRHGGGSSFVGRTRIPSADEVRSRYASVQFPQAVVDLLLQPENRDLLTGEEFSFLVGQSK